MCERLLVELQLPTEGINEILKEIRWNFPRDFFSLLEYDEIKKFQPLMAYLNSERYKAQQKKYKHKQYEFDLASLYLGKTFLNEKDAPTLNKIYVEPQISIHNSALDQQFWNDYRCHTPNIPSHEYYPLEIENKDEDIHSFAKKFLIEGFVELNKVIQEKAIKQRERFLLVLGAFMARLGASYSIDDDGIGVPDAETDCEQERNATDDVQGCAEHDCAQAGSENRRYGEPFGCY